MISFQFSRQNSLGRVPKIHTYMIFFREIVTFISRLSSFNKISCLFNLAIAGISYSFKKKIASYCTKMRGSVFRIIFLIFPRKFESVKTSPGFARRVSALRTYLHFFRENTTFSSRLLVLSFNVIFSKIMNPSTILLKKIEKTNENPVNLQFALTFSC